ncbi:hypothetical protein ABF87_11160 [Nitrosomonas sp. JL21]|uniref:hypothetical protein n=1 Tax=Nitrosomonas sp. JL21 TaxID=153949 RepID=UPI00136BA9A1|nr:hypothetical protein [Nitrosomonas sp. JL21]MBL8496935.1 hypothetical protein [Nitrosomonas sp.]MXS78508.1 hypothetical protein [Nitrosomonas sp. JL21]
MTELINHKHPLVKLAGLTEQPVFESFWTEFFLSRTERPATSTPGLGFEVRCSGWTKQNQ